jgi:magnesium chelatase family protein
MDDLHLSARAHDRILKVARTIADLAGAEAIAEEHLLARESWRAFRFSSAGAPVEGFRPEYLD